MRATMLSAITVGILACSVGCRTGAGDPADASASPVIAPAAVKQAAVSVIGEPVKTLIAAAARVDLRTEFFTPEGASAESMPAAGGSVSIHRAGAQGQDNYSFDANGRVTRHMRSAGANYGAGIWEAVP